MTEFTELDVQKDIDEMDEAEARETLADFMEQHKKNVEAYDERETEFSERLDEKQSELEDLQEKVSEFKQEKAEEAAEYANMPADILAERFEFSELDQIIEEAEESGEFTEDEDSVEDEDEDESLTTFSEKEQRGRQEGGGRSKEHRNRAANALRNNGFPASQ